jgi:hypothetical protein
MLARDQSRTSTSESSSRTSWCSRSHTPAACQARNLRQAVCPEPAPSCEGRSRHRQPVLSTNRMASSAARSSIGGRPPGPRSGGAAGSATRAAPTTDHRPTAAAAWTPQPRIRSSSANPAPQRHPVSSETRSNDDEHAGRHQGPHESMCRNRATAIRSAIDSVGRGGVAVTSRDAGRRAIAPRRI